MKTERKYLLYVLNAVGEREYLTTIPEPHNVCMIIKSKQSSRTINRVQLEEVNILTRWNDAITKVKDATK